MNQTRRFVLIVAAVAVVALGIAAAIYFGSGPFGDGAERTVRESRSFEVGSLQTIAVRASSMDVTISRSNNDMIEVRLTGNVWARSSDSVPELTTEVSGASLDIGVVRDRIAMGFGRESLKLDIGIPTSYDGSLAVRVSSSDLNLRDVSLDTIAIRTSSGDVTAESIVLTGTSHRVESSSGEVRMSLVGFAGTLDVETSSGDLNLMLPADAGFELDADTSSGDIEVGFPVTMTTSDRDSISGTVGSGEHRIRVRASSGDITIEPRGF